MSKSNNVKFVESEGKWLWKRYDENGSVIYRSSLFNTEREVREDYDINGEDSQDSEAQNNISTDAISTSENGDNTNTVTPLSEPNTAGTAIDEEPQNEQIEDNTAGQATI